MIQFYEFLGNVAAKSVVQEFQEMIKKVAEVGEPLNSGKCLGYVGLMI